MKVIIAGGRKYHFTKQDIEWLDRLQGMLPISEVVCGMAMGADTEGRKWAKDRGIPVKEFPADWTRYGKSAGPRRNSQMAEYADALVVFPGGVGTADMMAKAEAKGLPVFEPTGKTVE